MENLTREHFDAQIFALASYMSQQINDLRDMIKASQPTEVAIELANHANECPIGKIDLAPYKITARVYVYVSEHPNVTEKEVFNHIRSVVPYNRGDNNSLRQRIYQCLHNAKKSGKMHVENHKYKVGQALKIWDIGAYKHKVSESDRDLKLSEDA